MVFTRNSFYVKRGKWLPLEVRNAFFGLFAESKFLSLPVPEIMPDEAKEAGAAIVGTGRSDFPNQINNSLAFPSIFRGALDAGATSINNEMKIATAISIAEFVEKPTRDKIVPEMFDKGPVEKVSKEVKKKAVETKILRSDKK